MPLVYSYYHPVPAMKPGHEAALITLWRKSWSDCGWTPILLTHQVADAHPRAAELLKVVSKYPSSNPPDYDLACWTRWLALAQMKGGLMTDYDVIARAFSPEFLVLPDDVTVLDRGGVPCAVFATAEGAERIVDDIIKTVVPPVSNDGKLHVSDMMLFQQIGYPKAPSLTAPYGADGWDLAPAVHFSHADCARLYPAVNTGLPRSKIIKIEMSMTVP